MNPATQTHEWFLTDEIGDLRARLTEATETLRAIRSGEIDAVLGPGLQGDQLFTLKGADDPYRVLIEEMNQGAVTLSADGSILYCNRRFGDLLKMPLEEIVGLAFDAFVVPAERAGFAALLEAGRTGSSAGEITLCAGDASAVPLQLALGPLPAESAAAICLVATDISECREKEARLRGIQSQLEETNRDLVKRSEEIQYFYHTLSHELKTPLTSAREFVSIVIDGLAGELNPTQLNYLRIAKQSCTDLAVYINDLLDATRLDTGKLHIELKAASLTAIIERAMAIMEPVAAGKKIRLSGQLDPHLGDVMVDESRIMQILTNLLNNALKFTFEGGNIIIKLRENPKNPEYIQISVTDTGCGIPKDQIDNLFRRFYQIKKGDATPQQGVGLGLYLCREMVLLHGGNIWVESALEKGSTFSFTIPKHATERVAHVLIVDDDSELRKALCLVLEDSGFAVTTVAGGSDALQLIDQKPPDIVVLDLMMAGLDGPSTLKEIRKKLGPIPVIVHTGYPDSDLMERALESSPFTLLAKPCPPKRFLETVRRMCQTNEVQFLKKDHQATPKHGAVEMFSQAKARHDTLLLCS